MDSETQQYLTTNQAEELKIIDWTPKWRLIDIFRDEVSAFHPNCGQHKRQLLGEGEKSLGGED